MAKRPTQPKRPQPRDAKGRFTKRRPIPEALIARLGEGRSALAPYLDDAIPWVIVMGRKEHPQ
jgi:hypothetical protein